ncbi:MAG: M67 family metallopeptidase [Cyanobacteria bacterium CRU_2_1]|nr:M67 family metallopeptidase [Cyanobacteria bacterium RU_5_0]NJR60697.1 M67 family metallopeptidase [Cyanobacteria bacterium CRU_2_1]
MLQLTPEQLKRMTTHAERAYPEECCGLLIGRRQRRETLERKQLVEVWATLNAWSAEVEAELADMARPPQPDRRVGKVDRYWIDPKEILKAQRYARDHQLDIIGIYHSHPDHPSVPSECDRSLAWSQYTYIIVSVQHGTAQEIQGWSLDESHQFQPEKIVTVDSILA